MNKKPSSLKILEGNPGKRKISDEEPKPLAVIPKIPKDIDSEAKKVWKKLAPILQKNGLLTEADGESFSHLCQIRARLIEIHEAIKDAGSLIQVEVTADGSARERTSPYVQMERQYYQLFRLYAADFGLSPRGRVGLAVGTGKEKNELEDLLD